MEALSRILYVEDDLDLQLIAKESLEIVGGFTVDVCGSGAEALEAAPRLLPQLILLDVNLPGIDGPATLALLRASETLRAIPVVFVTGRDRPADAVRYRELGALGVLAKPFDPMTLADTVLAFWSTRPQAGPPR